MYQRTRARDAGGGGRRRRRRRRDRKSFEWQDPTRYFHREKERSFAFVTTAKKEERAARAVLPGVQRFTGHTAGAYFARGELKKKREKSFIIGKVTRRVRERRDRRVNRNVVSPRYS